MVIRIEFQGQLHETHRQPPWQPERLLLYKNVCCIFDMKFIILNKHKGRVTAQSRKQCSLSVWIDNSRFFRLSSFLFPNGSLQYIFLSWSFFAMGVMSCGWHEAVRLTSFQCSFIAIHLSLFSTLLQVNSLKADNSSHYLTSTASQTVGLTPTHVTRPSARFWGLGKTDKTPAYKKQKKTTLGKILSSFP